MYLEWTQIPYGTISLLLFCCYVYKVWVVRKLARKPFPFIGSPSALLPQTMLNLVFALNADNVLNQGCRKVRTVDED